MALHPNQNAELRGPSQGLALCAGYGGLEIGVSIAEPQCRTIGIVEREVHAAATLVARMADKTICEAPIWSDVKTFDGKPWRGKVDLITAGYPCQPFSQSGRQLGEADPRHLWPDIKRIITEVQPQWCFFENVVGHLDLGADVVIGDLQRLGYRVKAGLFSAAEVGASHLRQRLFIMAYADVQPLLQSHAAGSQSGGIEAEGRPDASWISDCDWPSCKNLDAHMVDAEGSGRAADEGYELGLFAPAPYQFAAWSQILEHRPDLQPELFGLAHGLAGRVERSRAAGNGVVPLSAAYAWRSLKAAITAELNGD